VAREVAALEQQGNLLKKVVRLVTPTVVHIEAERRDDTNIAFGRPHSEEAGSGVVIRLNGAFYVLTNRHVVKDAALEQGRIGLADGRVVHPTRVESDPGTDVAIMAVAVKGLTPARLGDSRKVEIGDFVLAVGSPFGLSHSVTYGIISAKGRRDLRLGGDGVAYQDFLQTDAAINPGNSGGPLLNLRGEVIGINTAIASSSGGSEGIGFTIPINMAVVVAKQLLERGEVVRAFLGVVLDSGYGPKMATQFGMPRRQGALVKEIVEDSPAQAADVHPGDLILRFDDVLIEDDGHLINQVSLTPVGKEVAVVLVRDGEPLTLRVKVGRKPN
jgi:serine protease Do